MDRKYWLNRSIKIYASKSIKNGYELKKLVRISFLRFEITFDFLEAADPISSISLRQVRLRLSLFVTFRSAYSFSSACSINQISFSIRNFFVLELNNLGFDSVSSLMVLFLVKSSVPASCVSRLWMIGRSECC